MKNSDSAHLSGDQSSQQGRGIPAREKPGRQSLRRVIQIDQLNLSPLASTIQHAGQLLVRPLDLREARLMALRQEVENGRYGVAAEQVAEKIMMDYLLEVRYPSTLCCSVTSSERIPITNAIVTKRCETPDHHCYENRYK
jgi:anti-sigma28 factor (negative regulator of flagellin synthesis)